MTTESETLLNADAKQLSPDLLQGMAAAIGVALTPERAAALAIQAGPHFAILRSLDTIADPTSEPAAIFRLATEPEAGA